MIPTINTAIETALSSYEALVEQDTTLGDVYKFDFANGDFEIVDGKPVICTDLEAVEQWVEACIRTRYGAYQIYEDIEFGSSLISTLLGYKVPTGLYLRSVAYADLVDKLLSHKSISSIQEFDVEVSQGIATISFAVVTTFGPLAGEVTFDVI
jgi:hypothetical protein